MDTPICDFVNEYRKRGGVRLHMPGHKGRPFLGVEDLDITEIAGADELYHPTGIIRASEENAAALFGAGKTVYSTEGSSLCIRAMIHLALLRARTEGVAPLILAGRNAHRAFLSAAALTDADIQWIFPEKERSVLSCAVSPAYLSAILADMRETPAAVYVTSPDYLGNMLDIRGLSAVCRAHHTPLLVDNAHGAYLRFLPQDRHPMTLGADMCCDSAHKTLPALTGGAYLHIAKDAPAVFSDLADRAMALFASTSPSYLILQSLDLCNQALAEEYPAALARTAKKTAGIRERLRNGGYELIGDEPIKITLAPKSRGYTGNGLHDQMRAWGMECEFSDPDYLTAMLTPSLPETEMDAMAEALLAIPAGERIPTAPPPLPTPRRILKVREALMRPDKTVPVREAEGRVLGDAHVGCPPCVPILVCGERIDRAAVECFRYYGVDRCSVVDL